MSQIVITANIKIKEEFLDEVYEYLVTLHNSTHKFDKACLQYDLHKDLDDKYTFVFVETWENKEALDKHMKTDHFSSFVKEVEYKLEKLEINKLEKLDI